MENYNELMEQIFDDVPDNPSKIPVDDSKLLAASSKEGSEWGEQYDRRDTLYSDLLDRYIKVYKSKAAWNKWYKLAFFVIAMLIFIGIVVVSLLALLIAAIMANDQNVVSTVIIAIGSMSGIISSIIVLPKIIAEHLFPTNEDENMIGMVKNMQVNDSKIRSFSRNGKG
ncbi:MAG: hypothetical protein IJ002_03010 [Clostridia bacterium]|nr:hypothetical protein [Clostridia bacterium]MBQ8836461.1 hypothetical protein [Clostridia bacterium]